VKVLHLHDWTAALVPVFVYAQGLPFKTVLTIHHVADQGGFWGLDFQADNSARTVLHPPWSRVFWATEFSQRRNPLRRSNHHGQRNLIGAKSYTPLPCGCGLDGVLRENAHRLSAILDGADYTRWNPASDRLLPGRYDARRLRGKPVCREALLKEDETRVCRRVPGLWDGDSRRCRKKASKFWCLYSIGCFGMRFA
jgi:starch synthase